MINKILKKLKQLLSGNEENGSKEPIIFLKKLKTEIRAFKTIFDIGTFKGNFIDEVLNANPLVNMHCFEPSKEAFSFLNKKYQHKSNVWLNNSAVSDYTGKASFNVNAFAETNSLLESAAVDESINHLTKKHSSEEVEVVKLYDYCIKNNIQEIDLIKIDTQGNTYNVLMGLEPMLKSKKIKYLYVEAEFVEIYKNEKLFSEIEILMRGFGYSIVNLYNLNYINKERLAWCDVLFIAKN